jgi:hypothetical protein
VAERVLVIDPGERVGWAVVTIDEQGMSVLRHGITGLKDFAVKLDTSFHRYDTVVYETYRIAAEKLKQHVGSDVPTLQLIGMIRLLSWRHPEVKLVGQGPLLKNTGRKYAAVHLPAVQELLDRLPKTHDDAHDGDAVLHAAAYYFKTRVKPGGESAIR